MKHYKTAHDQNFDQEDELFFCDCCGNTFSSKSKLDYHKKIETAKKANNSFQCTDCSKKFFLKEQLIQHKKVHDRYNNPECPKCEKRFSRSHVLERHLMTQHNIYHTYPQCSKTFLKKSVYNEHMKIHSNNKPHNCCMCTKSFSLQANLRKHEVEHSKEEKQCKTCDKKLVIKLMIEKLQKNLSELEDHSC